ncbi:MAG: ABC transporter permease subunit [Pseudomonadota bacterium]
MSLTLSQEEYDLQIKAVDQAASQSRNRLILGALAIVFYLAFFMFSLPERMSNWGGVFERIYTVNQELSINVQEAIQRMNPERARLYMLDTYAFKDHVTKRWERPDEYEVSLEGSFQRVYDETNMPDWISGLGNTRVVTFENGGAITINQENVLMEWPGEDQLYEFYLDANGKPQVVGYEDNPEDLPSYMRKTENKVEVRPSLFERLQVGTSKVEVHRYQVGWEHFWFDFDSPLRDFSIWQGVGLALSDDRITDGMSEEELDRLDLDEGQSASNAWVVFNEIRSNKIWGHGAVFWGLLETIFMALIGTIIAAFYGLPLAFVAAKNTSDRSLQTSGIITFLAWIPASVAIVWTPVAPEIAAFASSVTSWHWMILLILAALIACALLFIALLIPIYLLTLVLPMRFIARRLFDLLRGIDTLIWSLIFLRAFGPGLFTGIFAIAFTDTGTLGKLMSEAVENADSKQREGVQSVGASKIQQERFGILPQIMPVFISQSLYYLESNTRGAVIIGAMGAGGIGLQFLGALQTRNNFEVVAYLALLVLIVVIIMDWMSAKLRRALIGGEYK